jgi:hypothetical protein
VEHVEHQAQIAQDVMLVPRMVYVPYVAQTPVAPVRLSAFNTIPGRLTGMVERRETETPAAGPPPAPALTGPTDQDQLREQIKQLTEKLNRCEEALRRAYQPATSPCPPPQAAPQAPAAPECLELEIPMPQKLTVEPGPPPASPPNTRPEAPFPRQ